MRVWYVSVEDSGSNQSSVDSERMWAWKVVSEWIQCGAGMCEGWSVVAEVRWCGNGMLKEWYVGVEGRE